MARFTGAALIAAQFTSIAACMAFALQILYSMASESAAEVLGLIDVVARRD